jgi:hypothetical protein
MTCERQPREWAAGSATDAAPRGATPTGRTGSNAQGRGQRRLSTSVVAAGIPLRDDLAMARDASQPALRPVAPRRYM